MSVNTGKKARRQEVTAGSESTMKYMFKAVEPMNEPQANYLHALKNNDIVFAIGAAGTGKTYIASAYAAEQLYYKKINKIIITRPNVEAGSSLGHLPGELDEKFAPYLTPYLDTFYEKLGKSFTDHAIKSKNIEPIPLGFLRGRSFKHCLVVLDEAQNCTPSQMKLLLSRVGINCKMIIDGDINQCDLKGPNGLDDAISKLKNIKGIDIITFQNDDIVRSRMCKDIIMAYSK